MEWIYDLDRIRQTAKAFWDFSGENRVMAFHGQMGAGKTTFIHALCDEKNVKDPVSSPTFSIINEYVYESENELGIKEKKIFHLDLFRINSDEEARQAGVQDTLYSGHTCFVEWPEKAPAIFPPDTLHVFIDIINTHTRKLRVGNY